MASARPFRGVGATAPRNRNDRSKESKRPGPAAATRPPRRSKARVSRSAQVQSTPPNRIAVDFSRDAANYYSRSTGHKMNDVVSATRMILAATGDFNGDHATQWSLGAPHAWFAVRLVDHALRPTHYVYRGDMGGGGNHPRTWRLEASADGANWTTLRSHENDSTVANTRAGSWPLHGEEYYSHFRIYNEGKPKHLCCSGVDFYGDVRYGVEIESGSRRRDPTRIPPRRRRDHSAASSQHRGVDAPQ